ncbi:RluA family pseudouridine synthase [Cohnella lubricantis]|uniref:Pseudouridine synthase n=1 Tax=Cohnella lubricantis TaxID=2163172 RepID=A0A841T8J4_9BACL|nr:RluA family pseudouridine synthase [Cohnella lubricantis]MBB6675748.1 RluA family pseudouridine synthase [Cohnella lubricantis]MBP2118892.1 23S rRNA pseudouridine1911/1915/1917 synthase [Cohnella lubricantis]
MNRKTTGSRTKPDRIRTFEVAEGSELLAFLLNKLSPEGRNSVKSMLARGQVSVEGRVEKAYNYPLRPGQQVSVSKEKIVDKPRFIGLSILYEDDDLVVIQKDAGLLSISAPHEPDAITAYRQLMEHVRQDNPTSRIFVVHRLDRDTSGVMMFAKSEKVQQALQNDWQEAVQERSYIALVEGTLRQAEGKIESWLKESKTLKMYSSQRPDDGQHAVTHYKTLQTGNGYSLLEVRLETGRKNQIRVHMQDIGHPIVGDKKYGSRSRAIGRLGLHANVLSFVHPTTGKTLRFESPIPKALLRPFQRD